MGEEREYRGPPPKVPLERIDKYTWRVPQKYKPGMRVPGIVFADEELLDKMKTDRTLEQCANVSHLPGIYKHSITLPDGHEGYGFPIGGVAATDYEEGVISPGGVGYDINCLAPHTLVLTRDGYYRPIIELGAHWRHSSLKVFDLNDHVEDSAQIIRFIKTMPQEEVYRFATKNGREIIVTGDHPFLTADGMKPVKEIDVGEKVIIYPFEGVRYEEPANVVVVNEGQFDRNRVKELKRRALLPLRLDDYRIGILARLVGYILGDGAFYQWRETRKGRKKLRERLCMLIGGEKSGLEDIRKEILLLGFRPSKVYSRTRKMTVVTHYGTFMTTSQENWIKIMSKSFALLVNKLGVPLGKKVEEDFEVPSWVRAAPLWVKRNFLAGLFGAELTRPLPYAKHPFNFEQPLLTVSKLKDKRESGRQFLEQIQGLLMNFGVESSPIYEFPISEKTVGIRLVIANREANLIRLWSRIGYEYHKERLYLACLATEYLKQKQKHKSELKDRTKPIEFPVFNEYVNKIVKEIGKSGMVYEIVTVKEQINDYHDFVYDLTVNHKDHNFIANGFVVSNCGVRLLTTNLSEQDIRPKLADVTNVIFNNVPCGLGSRRKDFHITVHELDRLAAEGAQWVVDKGLGWPEDVKHCEERGCMEAANPDKVSTNAKSRGLPQVGTLGSGNHFLEVQRVDKIYNPQIAKAFGIDHEGQVTVMIHCGSRGYGHQVCSDYLRVMERAVHKYKIALPDRELACAPGTSNEAEDYYQAMACAVNYAFANRQAITHWVRQSFEQVFKKPADTFKLSLVYDVAHNIAKIEEHKINDQRVKVWVHRKGATRAFGPGRVDVPTDYRAVGQPVIIPGSMGTSSWVLVGTSKAMDVSFGSTAHGAGRMMSRAAAKRRYWGGEIKKALEQRGIVVRAASAVVLAEEADPAYKDVDRVAEVSDKVGIATRVARLVPISVVKG